MKNNFIQMTQKKSLLDKAVISQESTKITENITEIIIDSFLENGTLKDIPVIGSLVSSYKIAMGIKEGFFFKKVLKFLFELKDIPIEKREKLLDKMNADEKYSSKLGEKIMLYLDKTEEYDKASIIGKLYSCVLKEKIDRETFERLCFMLDKVFIDDLIFLKRLHENEEDLKSDKYMLEKSNLSTVGFLGISEGFNYQFRNFYKFNEFGKLMVELVLNDFIKD